MTKGFKKFLLVVSVLALYFTKSVRELEING